MALILLSLDGFFFLHFPHLETPMWIKNHVVHMWNFMWKVIFSTCGHFHNGNGKKVWELRTPIEFARFLTMKCLDWRLTFMKH